MHKYSFIIFRFLSFKSYQAVYASLRNVVAIINNHFCHLENGRCCNVSKFPTALIKCQTIKFPNY